MKPVTLSGQFISLEPLEEAHRETLRALASDPNISTNFLFPIYGEGFDRWFNAALEGDASGDMCPFVVRELATNEVVGSTRYYGINPKHRTLNLGYTWYIPAVWGAQINPEAKFLLLTYAFEMLEMHRVSFNIDARNARSRAAVKKLGAKEEGILRKHMVTDDGYVRDTVIYSIIDDEWPEVKLGLEKRLDLF